MAPPEGGPAPMVALTIVVPVFNEEALLPVFHQRLAFALAGISAAFEVIYVDDGSADVVNMRRRSRRGETWLKRPTAHAFYRLINRFSGVAIPEDVGDFRLFSRRAIDSLNRLPERNRFMKGLFACIGFRQVALDYDLLFEAARRNRPAASSRTAGSAPARGMQTKTGGME